QSYTNFDLNVFENPIVSPIVELKQCDDDLDGFSDFNLEEVKEKVSTNYLNETISFYETLTDAENGFPVISNTTTYTNQTISIDTIWSRVENNNGCFKTSEVNLIVSATQIPITFQRDFYTCDDDTYGIVSFNFSSVEADMLALLPAGQLPVFTYYQNLADALAETNAIPDISNHQNTSSPNYQDIYVRVDSDLDNSCLGLGAHISLTVETVPVANPVSIADECDPDGDGLYEFDTSTIESTLIGSQTNLTVFYFDELGNPLPSPLPNPFQTGTQIITARVENALSQDPSGACFDQTTISFSVDAAAIANPIADQVECDDDIDNQFPFDTSLIESTVLGSQTGMIVTYTDSNGTVLPSPLPNPFLTGNETITVRVENPLNIICYDETTFDFIVNERPQFELDEEDVICINESPSLTASTYNPLGVYSYSWKDDSGTEISAESFATVHDGGIYTVIATSSEGCESFPQEISINESELATITHDMVAIVDDSDNNTITIDAIQLGFGDYEYALDDEFGIYQDEPFFENVPAGIHIIYVRDKNDCGTSELEVSVIGYPKFFTPNNDGENDTWQIKGVNSDFYPNSIIHIYDRFGKIVANISPTSNGWDGYYNGRSLPSTDYWFSVQLVSSDGTVTNRQGNFSLVRR
ncbi:MAG: T9SS type B sorting domain-containing protein, partial [Urechidicola sp.]|nr:T9SS type B sorting domain-containing protein [Urechidicola sp.]